MRTGRGRPRPARSRAGTVPSPCARPGAAHRNRLPSRPSSTDPTPRQPREQSQPPAPATRHEPRDEPSGQPATDPVAAHRPDDRADLDRCASGPSGAPQPGRRASGASKTGSGATGTAGAGGSRPSGSSGAPRPSSSRTSSSRAGRRERQRIVHQRSFMERYRTAIVVVAALAGVALISLFVFFSASQAAYACSTIWTPDPTASPVARGHARARLRPAGHGPPARRGRREGDLHLLRPGVGQPHQQAGRRRTDPGPRLRPERQRHPAGLDPQPGARRPGRALPGQQHRRDRRGPGPVRRSTTPSRRPGTPKGAIGR